MTRREWRVVWLETATGRRDVLSLPLTHEEAIALIACLTATFAGLYGFWAERVGYGPVH